MVVDNETIAQLMNLEARVENEFYELMIARMRQNVYEAFSQHFEYKGGYLSCHDWRPREYNAQADAVCNWVLDECCDMEDLDVHNIAARLAAGQVLQLFSDGGFTGACGAASFVVVCSAYEDGELKAFNCGYRGAFMSIAVSSFQAELVAAEMAISFSMVLGKTLRATARGKRPRFDNF
jgi:hypothetical protein